MKGWFRRLPIHQKLVALALVVTAFALGLALLALAVFDIWRYRETATEEVAALAGVLAENTAASVAFDEPDSAAEVLRSIRVRDVVVKACIYRPDGRLFAAYARQAEPPCAGRLSPTQSWSRIGAAAAIVRNARSLGTVYVERDLSDLRRRLNLTTLVGVLVFLAAAVSAYLISLRIHASIAGPISALASFAKRFGSETAADPPDLRTAPDEVGDLSAAFTEMIGRVRLATHDAQEALSREREANRLKDEFLAAVSHELRTPLNAMMGWAQLLGVGEPSNETVRQAAASIVKNAHAQTRVIEDLIDVSRIATGKMRLAIEHVDLRTVVALAADTIQPVAEAKGVRLERRTEDVPCHVMGDRDRLVQILWNLLSNAVKFTPRGGLVMIAVAREGSRVRRNCGRHRHGHRSSVSAARVRAVSTGGRLHDTCAWRPRYWLGDRQGAHRAAWRRRGRPERRHRPWRDVHDRPARGAMGTARCSGGRHGSFGSSFAIVGRPFRPGRG